MTYSFKWPFPAHNNVPLAWRLSSRFTIAGLGVFSKIVGEYLNTIHVHNKDRLLDALGNRKKNQPLITVLNHHSCLDDPVLHGVLPWRYLLRQNYDLWRWCVAAQDVCFVRSIYTWFFAHGRGVPVVRGDGVYQRGMDYCIEKLNNGEWVHIFPEGGINLEKVPKRIKWGVGRLIADCEQVPLVLPMWHVGMDDILPNKTPYRIQRGQHVTLLVGDYIDVKEQLLSMQSSKNSPREIRKVLTDTIQEELHRLQLQAESLHRKLQDSLKER